MSSPPPYAERHCLSNFTFLRDTVHPQELVQHTDGLATQGFRRLRFWIHEVLTQIDGLVEAIWLALQAREGSPALAPHPDPSPCQGEGMKSLRITTLAVEGSRLSAVGFPVWGGNERPTANYLDRMQGCTGTGRPTSFPLPLAGGGLGRGSSADRP